MSLSFPVPCNTPPAEMPAAAPVATAAVPLSAIGQLLAGLLPQLEPAFHLDILDEAGALTTQAFADEASLCERLRQLLAAPAGSAALIHLGYQLQVSEGPLRYLLTPWGQIPLFDPLVSPPVATPDGFLDTRTDLASLLPQSTGEAEDATDATAEQADLPALPVPDALPPDQSEQPDIFTFDSRP